MISTRIARPVQVAAIAGAFAGLSGALAAQVAQIVGLDTLGFELSAEALVMLVPGGAGNLWGALVGTVVFASIHHWASTLNPYHWLFVIGLALMLVVLVPPGRWIRRSLQRFIPGASS